MGVPGPDGADRVVRGISPGNVERMVCVTFVTRLHAIDGIPWKDDERLRGLLLAELKCIHIQQAPRRTDIRKTQPCFLSVLLDCLQLEKIVTCAEALSLPPALSRVQPRVIYKYGKPFGHMCRNYRQLPDGSVYSHQQLRDLADSPCICGTLPMFSNLMVMGMLSPPRRTFCLPSFGIAQTGKRLPIWLASGSSVLSSGLILRRLLLLSTSSLLLVKSLQQFILP